MAGQTYYPAIPAIAQAYVNDPRTKLALQAQQAGADTSPVAGGKWAWASGLGRVGSGIVGAIESKQQQRQYDDKQQQVMNEVASALGGQQQGGTPAPMPQAPPVQPPVPQAMPAPQAPPQAMPAPQAPPQAMPAPQAPPQAGGPPPFAPGPQGAPTGVPGPQGAPIHPATPQIAAALGGGGAATPATPFPVSFPSAPAPKTSTGTQGTNVSGASLLPAMLPITAKSESNGQDFGDNGKPVTSPKGARFAMQVMPATARSPGFGIAPAKDNSPQEYNRVGTELLGKLTEKYGDPAKAWAAYNCGTGRVDHALAKNGNAWLAALPKETQAYVAKNCAALGVSPTGTPKAAAASGDEYQIPGQEPLPPTQQPGVPGLPQAPADRGAVHSLALDGGRKLLNTKDPFLYEQAMEMLGKGMGEQTAADQKALDRLNNRDDTAYEAGINDHYNAASQQRGDAYATGREMRGYAHEDNTLSRQQAFQRSEGATNDAFTAQQNQLNRDAEMARTKYTVDGRRLTAEETRAAKRTQFFQTPQGAKLYGDASDTVNTNNALAGMVDQFMGENNQNQSTGGFVNNTPYVAGAARILNSHMQTMDSISHQLAPMIRQKGQGSMSDRDLEMFERAVPSTKSSYQTNVTRAAQFKQYVTRMNDFETHKLQAAADGSNVDFLKSWTAYKEANPVVTGVDKNGAPIPGKSYDEWLSSIPHYDAQGNKK